MKKLLLASLAALVAAGPAFAQSSDRATRGGNLDGSRQLESGRSPGAPLDRGPRTPDANRAFMGGGVILEGAPGAPAPSPESLVTGNARVVQPGGSMASSGPMMGSPGSMGMSGQGMQGGSMGGGSGSMMNQGGTGMSGGSGMGSSSTMGTAGGMR